MTLADSFLAKLQAWPSLSSGLRQSPSIIGDLIGDVVAVEVESW